MIPKGGKVNIKTPQNTAGSPSITTMKSGLPSSAGNPIKTLVQQGTKHAQVPQKSSHPTMGSNPKPSMSGTKIKTKIQTGNPGSRTGKK